MTVIPANKPPLCELSQLIGIQLLSWGFSEIFGSSSQFTEEENVRFARPCGRPCFQSLFIPIAVLLKKNPFSFLLQFCWKGIKSTGVRLAAVNNKLYFWVCARQKRKNKSSPHGYGLNAVNEENLSFIASVSLRCSVCRALQH